MVLTLFWEIRKEEKLPNYFSEMNIIVIPKTLIKSALKKTLRNNLTYENFYTKITNKLLATKCNSTLKQKGVYIKNKRIVLCWEVYVYFIILVDLRRNSVGSYL